MEQDFSWWRSLRPLESADGFLPIFLILDATPSHCQGLTDPSVAHSSFLIGGGGFPSK